MANSKISALPPAATITGTEIVPVVQGGATKAATVTQLFALIIAGAPGNLDTFFETAARLGLDETTVTTLQTLVAGKLDTTQAAATYPALRATPPDHTVAVAYIDTSVVPPVLKGWDGTGWVPLAGGATAAVTSVINSDGTFTTSGTGVTDNGDGTYTLTDSTVTDNGDGTFNLAA